MLTNFDNPSCQIRSYYSISLHTENQQYQLYAKSELEYNKQVGEEIYSVRPNLTSDYGFFKYKNL